MSTIFLAFTSGQVVIPADLKSAKTSVGKSDNAEAEAVS
jgi:hypothetical protein